MLKAVDGVVSQKYTDVVTLSRLTYKRVNKYKNSNIYIECIDVNVYSLSSNRSTKRDTESNTKNLS